MALAYPDIVNFLLKAESPNKRINTEIISRLSSGSKYSTASPPTSGIEVTLDAMTGQPEEKASRTGIPKPSYREG